jgi:hypothetical protein
MRYLVYYVHSDGPSAFCCVCHPASKVQSAFPQTSHSANKLHISICRRLCNTKVDSEGAELVQPQPYVKVQFVVQGGVGEYLMLQGI